MIKLNHNLSLDLYYNEEKTIDTKEYDRNSRYITVSLTYKGEEYKISGNSVKARIKWLKPDKKPVFNDCVINSDNTITIDLTEQMLIVSGIAKATLSLYDINTDQVLSSTSFNAIIEASAVSDDTILSSDEYNSLHNEFKRLNDKVEELDKTVTEHENVREENEENRKSNEIKRETNESERINSENARINNENTRIDSENERVKNENTRIANENVRQHNEATRETQEDKRESDTAIAIEKANEAAKNANDKANDLQTKLDNHHFVLTDELENTISSDSTTTAPTANAVKIVNDKLDSHTNNHDNPHNITKEQIGLGNNDNTADMDKPVSTAQQKAIDDAYANSNKYTDKKIADLIGGAPETLDTLKEVADAISASKSTEEALNSAIGTKANQAELDTHTGNDTIHITSDERENWNDANDKKHTHSNKSVLDGITSALITAWNNAVEHITDTVKHITSSERTKWNAAYDKANNALPKTGGTLTGSLDIYGNASQNPLRTRGIVGSDGQGSDGDLYLQYGSAGNIYLGKNGSGCIDEDGKSYNGTAMSSRYPFGFNSYTPANITWGVQTGTPLVTWNTSNGGSIGFRDNCPADGQVSVVIDGRVYQDEGRYPVLDSNNYTSVITKQGICDILGYTPSTGSDSFEIGGTNLFHGTKEFEITNAKSFSYATSSVTSETYNGLKIRKNLTAWNFYRPILSLEPGNYVFSGYVKGVNGLSTLIQVSAGDTILSAYTFSITSDWKRYSITFEITEKSDVTFYLESREAGEIYECGWKLEKGNKATDWSPAPEDLESALSIRDYNDTSKKIKVGWVGNSLSQNQIVGVACYARGDDDIVKVKIKDVTKDTFKSWLGTVLAANNAAHLGRNGNAGYPMTFNWAGKDGQPSWLWGGENGTDMYVYNPSNFSVNYAASAGNAAKVNGHTVNSDVPSNAKFTDTNTWRPLGTGASDACAGNDSRLSNARPASDVYAWAKASAKPSYNWNEIGNKPTTFTPASHTHSYLPLSGGTLTGDLTNRGATKLYGLDSIGESKFYYSKYTDPLAGTTCCAKFSNAVAVGGKLYAIGNIETTTGWLNLQANNAIQARNRNDSAWVAVNALSFNQQSSRRYKKNIVDMTEEEAKKILQCHVVNYDYINEADGTNCQGLIAEEVAEICEYPVYRKPDGTIEGLDYSKFVPQLIKMVQIQQTEIDGLRQTIESLKN